jgi:hypothetical protein
MAVGKNAKKRAARRAFHNAPDSEAGKIPYAIHVIVHRDGKPEKIIFTSLTAFKAYRAEFIQRNPQGILTLVSDTDTVDDSKGKANRARVINKGIGQNWDRVSKPLPAPSKQRYAIDGFK